MRNHGAPGGYHGTMRGYHAAPGHTLLLHLCLFVLHFSLVNTVNTITMLTQSSQIQRRIGESMTLSCDFRAIYFNLFDNPVIWRKTQHHEATAINIQGTINPPFVGTNRFQVKFTSHHPVYRIELTVRRLTRADNGNYTCEVRGDQSKVLVNVTHQVVIQSPIDEVYITNSNLTGANSPAELLYTEGTPGTFRCVSHGGYPAPDVQVSIGEKDIGDLLSWTYTPNFVGPRGLRSLSYTVERWSHTFLAKPDFDDKEVLCATVVPGLTARMTAVRIRVNYLPQISCQAGTAYMGQRNVSITCYISSRPRTKSARWTLDLNGTDFDVMSSTAYWSTMRILNETSVSATLHISTAGPRRFREYVLIARNAVGVTKQTTQLVRGLPVAFTTLKSEATSTPPTGIAPSRSNGGSHYVFIISRGSSSTFHKGSLNQYIICLLYFTFIIQYR